MARKRKPAPKPADLLNALAEDGSLTQDEKVSLIRTLSGDLPARKVTEKQIPDWLDGKFAEEHEQRLQRTQVNIGRTYWIVYAFIGVMVAFGVGLALWWGG